MDPLIDIGVCDIPVLYCSVIWLPTNVSIISYVVSKTIPLRTWIFVISFNKNVSVVGI